MKIEWDPKKAANRKKHRVSFEEAATALSDTMAATAADPDHSLDEERYITFGVSERGSVVGRGPYGKRENDSHHQCPPGEQRRTGIL